MRPKYARFVELSNQGAREIGFADTGALWRSGYDMPTQQFSAELERIWSRSGRSTKSCTPTFAAS